MAELKERKVKVGAAVTTVEDICFPVEMRDEEMWCNKSQSKKIVGIIGGVEKHLNQCSNVYKLVPNEDIFPKIEQLFFNNAIDFEVTYKHINHVTFYADYKITDKRFTYHMKGTNDLIYPLLRSKHSYDGMTKYGSIFGYYRFICSNGMVVALEEMSRFNLSIVCKHTEQILNSLVVLNEKLQYFVNNASEIKKAVTSKYEVLGSNWIENPANRIKSVLEAAKIIVVDNNKFNTVNDIMGKIMKEANNTTLGYDGKVNDWLIYNGINQYIYDDNRNIASLDKRMEVDSKVLELMLDC